MSRLIILRGISGSGKSTSAEGALSFGNPVVVSRDALRLAYFGSAENFANEDFITKAEHAAIETALRAGYNVVSDNTNIQHRYVNALVKLAYANDAEVEVIEFDVALEVALRRNKARGAAGGRFVPEDVIRRQKASYKPYKMPPRPVITPYTGTPGKPTAIMVDIDGTLADMAGRRGPYDWHKVHVDEPVGPVIDIVQNYKWGAYNFNSAPAITIVMSGRDATAREATEEWLGNYIDWDYLFMRPKGDMRSDDIIKHELFNTHVRDNYDVQFVIDDRPVVCRMWRRMGIRVFQVGDPHVEF